MGRQTVKPPAEVREAHGLPESVTLGDVHEVFRKRDIGHQWARRILRRENILKASQSGTLSIPDTVDLRFGPAMIAVVIRDSDASVVAKSFEEADIPSLIMPMGDTSVLALLSYDPDLVDIGDKDAFATGETSFPAEAVQMDKSILVDENARIAKSIRRASGFVGYRCSTLPSINLPVSYENVYLLETADTAAQHAQVIKVDDSLGLIFGWAIVSTVGGEAYFDKQDDHITEDAMLKASADFMEGEERTAGEMHFKDSDGSVEKRGKVVFAWPLTEEIAKAFDIECSKTGLMVAVKPDDEEILDKFRDGTYSGFSIGGVAVDSEFADT